MQKIILIICYFGKLPNYFDLYLETCKYNDTIDFLMFTDQKCNNYNLPNNFKIELISFKEFKEKIQSKFNFKIVLDSPYKICDYRPAFGYVFSQYIENYDFWGHCDIDMMWGDIRKFLPDDISNYEKLYKWGHLTLYKNSFENNLRFKENGGLDYKEVFSSNNSFIFDEMNGIDYKYNMLNLKKFDERVNLDLSTKTYRLTRGNPAWLTEEEKICNNFDYQLFYWKQGHIYRIYYKDKKLHTDEFNYIHFQKRNMEDICKSDAKCFLITNKGFIEYNDYITIETIKEYNNKTPFRDLSYRILSYKKRIINKIKKEKYRMKNKFMNMGENKQNG